MYRVKLTKIAAENLRKIDLKTRDQILNMIETLRDEPLLPGKPLRGPLKEYRSIRAAGQRYRIIYKVEKREVFIIVVAVGIRKDGDKKDIYALMQKYVKIGLLEKND